MRIGGLLCLVATILLAFESAVPILAQDEGVETPDPPSPTAEVVPIETITFTPSLSPEIPVSSATPLPTLTATSTSVPPTTTPTGVEITPEVELSETLTATQSPPPTATESPETLPETTPEITAPVELPTDTPEVVVSSGTPAGEQPSITVTAAGEATEESAIPTDASSPTSTAIVTSTVEPTPIPTATLGIPMTFVQGIAFYQNHQPDQSGISVEILDENRMLLSVATTDPDGLYSVAIPLEQPFWVAVDAPLHRRFEMLLLPGEVPPVVLLAGGDLDSDGCIGAADISLLTSSFGIEGSPIADIDGSGVTDTVDLALLTGNYDPACGVDPVTPTPTPEDADLTSTPTPVQEESTPEITAAATEDSTDESLPTSSSTPLTPTPLTPTQTPLPMQETAIPTAPDEATPTDGDTTPIPVATEDDPTTSPIPTAVLEPTETAEVTPDVTAEG